jgi:hypothetical protein
MGVETHAHTHQHFLQREGKTVRAREGEGSARARESLHVFLWMYNSTTYWGVSKAAHKAECHQRLVLSCQHLLWRRRRRLCVGVCTGIK